MMAKISLALNVIALGLIALLFYLLTANLDHQRSWDAAQTAVLCGHLNEVRNVAGLDWANCHSDIKNTIQTARGN